MLKKYVRRVLLPLLFSFCFVFSGFLNVNASAQVVDDLTRLYDYTGTVSIDTYNTGFVNSDGSLSGSGFVKSISNVSLNSFDYYPITGNTYSNIGGYRINFDMLFSIPFYPDKYDYYFLGYYTCNNTSYSWNIDDFFIVDGSDNVLSDNNKKIYLNANNNFKGFIFTSRLNFIDNPSIKELRLVDFNGGSTFDSSVLFFIVPMPKDSTEEALNSVITAINNQTGTLGGKLDGIDSSVNDVQQSIEDQYSGDPETEFSVDDVITQHNEKMGVLSFGSDVMLQFLDMFQSANVGTAELTLPGFNITVENVEYSVWPDYSFNFEQLNEWVPALMSVIRVMLPAFVWLMVLRYCIKVFEDNFLAK